LASCGIQLLAPLAADDTQEAATRPVRDCAGPFVYSGDHCGRAILRSPGSGSLAHAMTLPSNTRAMVFEIQADYNGLASSVVLALHSKVNALQWD
jgi:hypothetical protein